MRTKAEPASSGRAAQRQLAVYRTCIQHLFEELKAAGESDFDGLLREAVDTLLLTGRDGSATATAGASAVAVSLPLSDEQQAALERVRTHRYHGSYKGKAAERELRGAVVAAEHVRVTLVRLAVTTLTDDERSDATNAYVMAVDRLRVEVERGGELDMDGLLRQAAQVLESAGVCRG